MNRDGLTTITKAAEYLDVSRSKVYSLMKDGLLPFVKMVRSRRIRWVDLETMIRKMRNKK